MTCPKCGRKVPEDSVYCSSCGKKLVTQKKKSVKARGNGQGSAYRRGNTWTAIVTVGWLESDDPSKPKKPDRRTRGGFRTKKEAIEYCVQLKLKGNKKKRMTLQQVWNAWSAMYEDRIVPSTMDCYRYAFKHFSPLHSSYMDTISADDLQKCMDECTAGKRTHQNMKCIAGLLWGYAVDQNATEKKITENLYIGKGTSVQRDPIDTHEVEAIKDGIGSYRYAEYVYCLCYLGFRPGEMLELTKDMVHVAVLDTDDGEKITVWYFVNGKKTPAGKDRIVIIPDQIIDIVISRLYVPGTNLVFPQYVFNRKKEPQFIKFKPMSHEYFNKHCFQPLMASLGLSENKVPYCARHTYADLLKHAPGSDKDKASMFGHSQYMFTQDKYQSTHIAELKAIVDGFK